MADHQEQHYQPEQNGMYELEFPAPQLSATDGRGPVLIHALEGFSDAGHAIRLAAQHLGNEVILRRRVERPVEHALVAERAVRDGANAFAA